MAMAAARLSRRTQTDPLAYFTPTQPQLDFLSHTSRIRLARSGNQIGKTTMGLVDLIYRALGSHPYQLVRAAPIEAWILCQSWESSLSIQGKLWELLPKDSLALDTEYTAGKGFRGKTPVVRLRNGSIIRVRTVAQGTLALAGSTIDVCLIDEPCPESVYNEIIPRVFARNGVVMITLTPVGADLKWLKALVEAGIVTDLHFPLTPENTRPIGAREPRKTQAQIDELANQLLPQERAQRLDGEWEGEWAEDRVFRAFDPARHVKDEAPVGEVLIGVGIDHGTEAGAQVAILSAVLRDGGDGHPRIWVLDQVQSDGMTTPEQDAEAILGMLKRAGLRWENVDRWVGDRRVFGRKNGSLKSNAMLMTAMERRMNLPTGSLPFRIQTAWKPKGSVYSAYRLLQACMLQGGFMVHPRCKGLIDDLLKFDGREASEHKHAIDALRYGAVELVSRRLYNPTAIRLG